MAGSEGDKTEKPTARRREEARRQGNVWQPRELAPAAAVATAALAVALAGPGLWLGMAGLMGTALGNAAPATDDALPIAELAVAIPWRPPAGLAAAVALVTTGAALATSRHVSLSSLAPKFARLSPVQGLQRIFSMTGAAGALTATLKLAAVAGVAGAVVLPLLPRLASIGDDAGALVVIGNAIARLLGAAALVLVAIAVLDAGISFVLRERKLMMSLDEVKRESRQNDGSPEVKAAIRRAQHAAATRRMRGALADAAVVVVNPVHFAVAMRYRPMQDAAPVVVEKGQLEIARAIAAAAGELKIPVIRSPRLARALFFSARIGDPVREELFAAVATILAFVMRFDDVDPEAAPAVFVPAAFDFDATGARRRPGVA